MGVVGVGGYTPPCCMQRPCATCGVLIAEGYRCFTCDKEAERARDARRGTRYTWQERKRMRLFVEDYVARNGYWCPGYARGAHESTDLQADHIQPIENAGHGGPLQVLCGPCNRRRAAQFRKR